MCAFHFIKSKICNAVTMEGIGCTERGCCHCLDSRHSADLHTIRRNVNTLEEAKTSLWAFLSKLFI